MDERWRKVYVSVSIDINREGYIRPRSVKWENGRVYEIDGIKHKCRTSSLRVGGYGVRYTVLIRGKETYLYDEDGRWFVEARA